MLDLTTTNWFPVATLIIGYATKALSDWVDYRRNTSREREAREAARKDQRYQRRMEFQRQTLLDLQETAMQLARATGQAHLQDKMAFRTAGIWKKQLLPNDLAEAFRLAQARALMLYVRVLDNTVRKLANDLQQYATQVAFSATEEDSESTMMNVISVHEELHERIGEILRKIDSADD